MEKFLSKIIVFLSNSDISHKIDLLWFHLLFTFNHKKWLLNFKKKFDKIAN